MKILVNGREAVLKANASFEYVSENPLFTEAEDYTMEIPFPMEDCPQNISIFGPLHVKGVDISKVSFPCEIQTDAFVKSGILTITSVSDTEVKGQFLEGMSQQNFASSLPDVYLTDLDFSQWDGQETDWGTPDAVPGWDVISVWDNKSEDLIATHNYLNGDLDQHCWSKKIYLSYLIELVGKAMGMSVNYEALKKVPFFTKLLVVNTRRLYSHQEGHARPLAYMLPRWTVKEFFNELALFFGCTVNVSNKQIAFKECSSAMVQSVNLETLDDYSIEFQKQESPIFRGSKLMKLPDDCNPNNINICPYIVDDKRIPHFELTYEQFINTMKRGSTSPIYEVEGELIEGWKGLYQGLLYHITDRNLWAIVTESRDQFVYPDMEEEGGVPEYRCQVAEILNQYNVSDEGTELKIAPCPLKDYKYPAIDLPEDFLDTNKASIGYEKLEPAIDILSSGEREEDEFYYNKLWVVICEHDEYGRSYVYTRKYEPHVFNKVLQDEYGHPIPKDDGTGTRSCRTMEEFYERQFTLSPSDPSIQALASLPKVDETKLYRYKFLAKTLPSPTSVFLIKGKRYACLKLTAQITVKGMSELVEGEFYEIID